MGIMNLHKQDLIELYQLANIYMLTYGTDKITLQDIADKYRSAYKGDVSQETNPRGAGRKKIYGKETTDKIMQLHNEGYTVRTIAQEVNVSIGYVQNTIANSKVYSN